jgi:hypothetical protein
LEPWGFEVRETHNGREGVEASIVGAAGCDEFIRKPLREEYIVKAMADHIGVQFIYEEATEAPATTAHRSLTADVLAILARRADHPRIAPSWPAEITAEHGELAAALSRLADDFQFDEILTLAMATGTNNRLMPQ